MTLRIVSKTQSLPILVFDVLYTVLLLSLINVCTLNQDKIKKLQTSVILKHTLHTYTIINLKKLINVLDLYTVVRFGEQIYIYFWNKKVVCSHAKSWRETLCYHGGTCCKVICCSSVKTQQLTQTVITHLAPYWPQQAAVYKNSMKLVIPLHFISWKKTPNDAVTPQGQGQFTPKIKANAEPRLLSSLVWIDSGIVVSRHRVESFCMKWNVTEWQVSWNSC